MAITFGSEYTQKSSAVFNHACVALDATHFVIVYADGGNGTALIATVSGNTLSFGSPTTFNAPASVGDYPSVCALSSTKFVVAYGTKLICGSVSGTTITFGTVNDLGGVSVITSITALSATVAIFTKNNEARAISVSGTTITVDGTGYTYDTGTFIGVRIVMLDSTHFAIAYSDSSAPKGWCVIGTGTTSLTFGTPVAFHSSDYAQYADISLLDSSHFVIWYREHGTNNLNAIVGVFSGTTISSFGTAVTLTATSSSQNLSCVGLDATHFVVLYAGGSNTDARVAVGNVSGTVITFDTSVRFKTGSIFDLGHNITKLSASAVGIVYGDSDAGNFGRSIVGLLSTAYTITATQQSYALTLEASILRVGHKIIATFQSYAVSFKDALFHLGKRLLATQQSYAVTFENALFHSVLHITVVMQSYAVTFESVLLKVGHTLVATYQSYALSFKDALFKVGHTLIATYQLFTLTFESAIFTRMVHMVATVANFNITAFAVRLLYNGYAIVYSIAVKHTATMTNAIKNSATMVNVAKSITTWINRNKT